MRNRWIAPLLLLALVACASSPDGCTVTLVTDGRSRTIVTEVLTVRELLAEADATLSAEDRVSPAEPTLIQDGMTIRIVRVETHTEKERRQIPFERRTVRDTSIPEGDTKLLEPGRTGVEEVTYQITLEDGVEVDRRVVGRVTVREPRAEVVLVGGRPNQKPISITGTIAYIANQNAWVMRGTSSNQGRLTHEGDLDGRVFALSADGSQLLFTRLPTETEDSSAINTLWIVDTSTVDAEPAQLEVNNVLWAEWEPDCDVTRTSIGCRIAFATGTPADGNPGWRANNDLWIARARPGAGEVLGRRRVVEPSGGGSYGWWGTSYAWSPNGQRLAYAQADGVGVIRAYDGHRTQLAQFPPFRTYASWVWVPSVGWSPEGEFIVTTLHGPAPTGEKPEDSPVFDVWTLAADGTTSAKLASEAGMWSAPAFAPETELIAFGRARDPRASQTSNYDLCVMDRDGSDQQPVFPPDREIGVQYPEIAWGPAGDRFIAIYRENLYLIEVPGDGAYQLTDGGGVTAVQWR